VRDDEADVDIGDRQAPDDKAIVARGFDAARGRERRWGKHRFTIHV
jgi:hypothetical protein